MSNECFGKQYMELEECNHCLVIRSCYRTRLSNLDKYKCKVIQLTVLTPFEVSQGLKDIKDRGKIEPKQFYYSPEQWW